MSEEFVSESIKPVAGTSRTVAMSRGRPVLPGRFIWRGKEYTVAEVLQSWKQSGPCKSGGSEMYLRKHWFKVKTADGLEMTIYFESRQVGTRSGKAKNAGGCILSPASGRKISLKFTKKGQENERREFSW